MHPLPWWPESPHSCGEVNLGLVPRVHLLHFRHGWFQVGAGGQAGQGTWRPGQDKEGACPPRELPLQSHSFLRWLSPACSFKPRISKKSCRGASFLSVASLCSSSSDWFKLVFKCAVSCRLCCLVCHPSRWAPGIPKEDAATALTAPSPVSQLVACPQEVAEKNTKPSSSKLQHHVQSSRSSTGSLTFPDGG